MGNSIRVLLVDASPLALKALQQVLKDSAEIEVVGMAKHGREALRLLPVLTPEVICMAAHLPVLDGPDLTREVMSQQACPILVLTSEAAGATPAGVEKELVTACLQAGAVDTFSIPAVGMVPNSPQASSLIAKVKLLARIKVISRSTSRRSSPQQTSVAPPKTDKANVVGVTEEIPKKLAFSSGAGSRIIAIGASTGGPQTLLAILSVLPRDYPFPILCVQHISKGFIGGLVDWLQEQCKIRVKIAVSGESLRAGTVYFPEDDQHLELDEHLKVKVSSAPPLDGHRPSVTALFNSVAKVNGSRAVAVLLTGMGADGAQGLKTVYEAGGTTIVQDKATSIVFGMPAKAIELGVAQHVMSPNQIARQLIEIS